MSKIAVVSDSQSCLPQELIKQYGITVVPMTVVIDGKPYRDQVDITIDEFWKIKDMDNFPEIKDVIKLLSFGNYRVIISGSAETLTREIAKQLGFRSYDISRLTVKDIGDSDLHYYSQGIAYYADAIKSRMKQGYNVKQAFIIEALSKDGRLYSASKFILGSALSRARGKTLLYSILNVLSDKDMRLNEISKHIYRPASVTKNLLSRLISVDLIVQDGRLFRIKDSILRFWLKQMKHGIEFEPGEATREALNEIEVDL